MWVDREKTSRSEVMNNVTQYSQPLVKPSHCTYSYLNFPSVTSQDVFHDKDQLENNVVTARSSKDTSV